MTEAEEILEYLAESYYPEHEYNAMWRERNAELRAEALAALSVLVEGCLPEEWKTPERRTEPSARQVGYNECRDEIRNNLKAKGLLL